MIVLLDELKEFIGGVNFDDDNRKIESLGLAAEIQVANWLGRPIYASTGDLPAAGDPKFSPVQMVADEAIKVAIKMLAREMYWPEAGIGSTAEEAVPPATVRALLSGARVFHTGSGVSAP